MEIGNLDTAAYGCARPSERELRLREIGMELKQQVRTFEVLFTSGRNFLFPAIAGELTGSMSGFIGEIGPAGYLHNIGVCNSGWESCPL